MLGILSNKTNKVNMSIPLITVQDLVISQSNKLLINKVDFAIHKFDRIILVGENGSGKSTLLKTIKGTHENDKGNIWKSPNLKIEYLDQNPRIPIIHNLTEFISQDIEHPNISKIGEIIEELNIQNIDLSKTISGGELRKIFIAKALLQEPDIILLDEPTNHIDLPTIGWLEQKLINIRTTMIVISHDQEFLKKIGTKTFWLSQGKLRKRDGKYEGFFEWSEELKEIEKNQVHKLKQKIKTETKWSIEGISARRKRNMGRIRELDKLNEDYSNLKVDNKNSIDISLNKTSETGSNIIEALNLSFKFNKNGDKKDINKEIIKDFNYKIKRLDRIGVIGANGSGKTTLIKLFQGIFQPTSGAIKIGERLNIKYFDQNKETLNLDSTPWKTLTPSGDHVEFQGHKLHVLSYLKKFLFDEKKSMQSNSTLSGGEKVRLLLSKLFLNEHNFLILDEPTNDLDFETLNLLKDNIKNYNGTVLIVSHDRYFLDATINKLIVFENDNKILNHSGNFSDYYVKYGFSKLKFLKLKDQNKVLKKSNQINQTKNKIKLSFKEDFNLKLLPKKIEKLELQLAKSENILNNNNLYDEDRNKFDLIINQISLLKEQLSEAEDDWLNLQLLQDEVNNIK